MQYGNGWKYQWIHLSSSAGVTLIKSFDLSQPASSSVQGWWKDNRKYVS